MKNELWEITDCLRGHFDTDDYLIALSYSYLKVLEDENAESEILKMDLKESFEEALSQEELNYIENDLINNLRLDELKELLIYLFTAIDYSKQTMRSSSNDSILNLASSFFQFDEGRFADLCSGNGAILNKALAHDAQEIKGIEINELSYQLSIMRLWLEHDVLLTEDIEHADVFDYFEEHPEEKYKEIFSQFPINLKRKEKYIFDGININRNSDWGFISLVMNQLKEEGRAVVISSLAIETRKSDEEIRQHFIQEGYIEEVIALPAGILTGTGIPSFLLVLSYDNESIRFTDASEIYSGSGRVRYISEEDVDEILNSTEIKIDLPIEKVAEKGRLSPDFYLLPQLNEGIELDKLAKVLNSRSIRKKEMDEYSINKNNGFEIIRVSHVKEGKIQDGDFIKEKIPKLIELEDLDLLITRISSKLTIALYRKEEMHSYVDENFFVVRIKDKKISPYYLFAYLQSEMGQKYLLSNYSGVTIQRINKKDLLQFKVPTIDPISESKIAKKTKEYMEEIDRVELALEVLEEEKIESINNWFKEE